MSGVDSHVLGILDVLVRTSLLLAPALLFALFSRRSSAAVRHVVCFLAVLAALAIPGLSSLLPGLDLPVLPAPAADEPAVAGAGAGLNWDIALGAFLTVWLLGVFAITDRILGGVARARALCRWATPVTDGRVLSAVIRARREMGLDMPIRVLSQRRLEVPFTWGILRPVVLLPRGATAWSRSRLRAVLLHELSHVRRRDCLTQFVADLACAVYWFHPLVWFAALRMRVERERACDDTVVVVGGRPSGYAVLLLRMVKGIHAGGQPAKFTPAATFADGGGLTGRLRALLGRARERRSLTPAAAAAFALGALTLVLPVAAVRLTRQLPGEAAPASVAAVVRPVAPEPRPELPPPAIPDPVRSPAAAPARGPVVETAVALPEVPARRPPSPALIAKIEKRLAVLAGRPLKLHLADDSRPRTADVPVGFIGGFTFYVEFQDRSADRR